MTLAASRHTARGRQFAAHVGRPLTAVPDRCGRHQNWPEHFKEPLRESLARLGIRVTMISQTQMYTYGSCTAVRGGRPSWPLRGPGTFFYHALTAPSASSSGPSAAPSTKHGERGEVPHLAASS